MTKLRISNVYLYENLPQGGASEICKSLKNYLLENKVQFKVITDKDIRPRNIFEYLYYALIATTIRHKQVISKMNINGILIAHHSWLTKSPHVLRYYKGKKVYICQEVMREYYDPEHMKQHDLKDIFVNILRLPIKYFDKINVKNTDIIIANSNRSSNLINKAYGKKSVVIYPGINTDKLKAINYTRNQVITISPINKYKNILFLVRVIGKIKENERPNFTIISNGHDNSYRNKVLLYAKQHKVSIKILNNLSKNELFAELQRSKVFLFSPISEPFGLVILEAMKAGLPLFVDKNGGGYSEIISNRNGILMENTDPEYWASELTKLLIDKNLLKQFKEYNTRYVNRFSEKIMSDKIFKLISKTFNISLVNSQDR